jgi:hypothetical protein
MIELYTVADKSNAYDDSEFETRDKLQVYLSEIVNLLNTAPGAVIGAMNKGVDMDSLVYEMGLNESEIASRVSTQLQMFSSMSRFFTTKIDVKFSQGTIRDICFVNVTISGSGSKDSSVVQFRLK